MKKTLFLLCSLSLATLMQATSINNTAGGLATALGANLTTCTDLVVTGNIDATDFLTMKSSMTALKTIDLSAATVVPYTGTGGTAGISSQTYPANAIPKRCFASVTKLTSLILPNSITSIETEAFYSCYIPSITIPSLVSSIGLLAIAYTSTVITVDPNNATFSSVDGVVFNKAQTKIIQYSRGKSGAYTIPSSVTTIGQSCFEGCSNLTSVVIPSGVTSIENYAFWACTGLTSITVNSSTPVNLSNSTNVFINVNKTTCTLYVPTGTAAAYDAAAQWTDFTTIVEYTPTDISTSEAGKFGIAIDANLLTITNAPIGQTVVVYTINGAVISNQKANSSTAEVALPAHGVYIVKVGAQSEKMVY